MFLLGILIFKGFTARRLQESFVIKGLQTNWWRGTTARKDARTRFKLLHYLIVAHRISNLYENRQTVVQTVRPHHKRSNCLRNSPCWANCLTVYGVLYTHDQAKSADIENGMSLLLDEFNGTTSRSGQQHSFPHLFSLSWEIYFHSTLLFWAANGTVEQLLLLNKNDNKSWSI
jgi:hypothetical protein